jgi:hypothetical protein
MDIPAGLRHCDDVADDPTTPEVVRRYLARARMPGHGMHERAPYPKLFATYKSCTPELCGRVRVTMASRLGDVGVTFNLEREFGYDLRCFVDELADFSDTP